MAIEFDSFEDAFVEISNHIIDNPEFNEDYSENSRYILVLYGIDRIGTMGIKLRVLETFKSSI
jgi:hypothetical protein